jgi:hypothetical protein
MQWSNMKNARFWHWSDGWVKLTLRPGQTLHWHEYHRTDEGHSFQTVTWHHYAGSDGQQVIREWSHGGRDCDGHIATTGTDACPLSKLIDRQLVTGDDPPHPDWQEVQPTEVNDQNARLANY